ncbi:hypothetical protein vBAbaMPhT2_066 [Acinetobacter phage vB_AbaM_PhT2]|uniref:Uncharacterized protein n=2 Tax=Hadassahvirus TaxID=2842716 RepID=A0A6B9SYP9_9CAUD|nr:hypothetical protein HYP74_gp082 [Acinetobacter phage AbTZA1]YP_009887086.1 hypothetical protein HYQ24_gp066 [Acinetobacter phage vB_AbaM_PhT2]QQM13751.1 hypothetical protein CPT_Maestro_017 [Acinetobacter phage Maestro]QQM18509.1 hypothetical protein CPT_Morttis_016 [Acinetobacter phage Morttis]QQO96219.1 hypothetical protein CPT_Minot_016 [Acinetobacter phage Minot]QQO96468.1 hypothetical protein CPT_Mokit_017 [Acinetobacter phage Mokit]QQO96718.1 hypothetical protein CPT_Melin_017 [Acin
MNLPYEALVRIMDLIRWVIDNGRDQNDFTRNVFYAYQPFYNLGATLAFCEDQATVTIPFALAMDINSVVLAHSLAWETYNDN